MIKSIQEELKGAKTVGITGHLRPDGDCVGSTLGLYLYIKANMPEIKADIYLEPIEKSFNFLSCTDEIQHQKKEEAVKYDVFFVLDCHSYDRVADFTKEYIENAGKRVCIDHHIEHSDSLAEASQILPKVSSASEVLFELLDEKLITKEVAECLYLGVIHDTGVLKYQSVTRRTMEVAGILMEKGIDYTSIIDDTFYRKTYLQNILMGHALINSKLAFDGRLIYSSLSAEMIKNHGATGHDLGGIIDQMRFTEGVEIAMFLYELPDGKIKGSLRSVHDFDVNEVAVELGGGGHIRAAGFSSELGIEELTEKVMKLLAEKGL